MNFAMKVSPAEEPSSSTADSLLERRIAELQDGIIRLRATVNGFERPPSSLHDLDGRTIRLLVRSHRERGSFFADGLFSDPAWNILLEAYSALVNQEPISIVGLCSASGVPESTAARWIRKLETDGWLTRVQDPLDGRRSWIQLSANGYEAMDRYFARLCSAFSRSKVSETTASIR